MLDQGGHSVSSVLDMINSLTKPKDTGHVCGIRFLIIDDSTSNAKNLSESTDYLIRAIKSNCAVHLNYDNKRFMYNGKEIEVVHIDDDLNEFIQHRATKLAQDISNLEKQFVSLNEVVSTDIKDPDESIYRIPVGKSGNSVVEIPLSCKDDNGTVDGQCIGYLVIGSSGSGKSSFFHSVVINGCLHYSPAALQFWLLDFKYGGASSKYRKSQIPHVRIVAENNKIDDALCLFQMIFDEMERRNKLINKMSVDNIVEYNSCVEDSKRLPRIIVMIDEVQEIFRDDNAAELQRMIASISVRMRSVGMHFIMVAQNLSEGKSYMLKDAFMPSATGRICFRVAENMPRESSFDEAFIERRNEIAVLSTGEAYVSWGKDTIKKVKMAFASPEEMNNNYFVSIKEKYPEFSYLKPMVIGSKKRLSIIDSMQNVDSLYVDEFRKLNVKQELYETVIGEDSYRMTPLTISFSSFENSSLLLLGDDKEISSSLCTSIALSLAKQSVLTHLFNADRQKSKYEDVYCPHPFMHICGLSKQNSKSIISHSLNEFSAVLADLYSKYIDRMNIVQNGDDEESDSFESVFLVVNDLFGIQQFVNNIMIGDDLSSDRSPSASFIFDILDEGFNTSKGVGNENASGISNERIQDVLAKLVKDGYRYNIHIILAIKGDPNIWRNIGPTDVNRVILFNSTQYTNFIENQFYVREMLKNISPETGNETLAVCIDKKHISKMRPFIYDMSDSREIEQLEMLLEVGE